MRKTCKSLLLDQNARWFDRSADVRVNMAIFDLIQKLNKQNQQIVDGRTSRQKRRSKKTRNKQYHDPLVALQ